VNTVQVKAYKNKVREVVGFRNQSTELFDSLVYFSTKEVDENKLISNFNDLIVAADTFLKQLPFVRDLGSVENRRIAGDHSNLNQLIITAAGTRACLNK
jgi:hypothetical protein